MKRQPLIAANWKMNGALNTIRPLLKAVWRGLDDRVNATVAICPPFPYLQDVARCIEDSQIMLGAQDLSAHAKGAYTGDVAGYMLQDYQCRFVIIGHSERRKYHAEADDRVAEKFRQAVQLGLTPILCVGESPTERDAGDTETVIAQQLDAVVCANEISDFSNAVVAYEPVWAIGTGNAATPLQAQTVHAFIRLKLAGYCSAVADTVRIIYGGSVNAANAPAIFKMEDIDGGLIGGASLVADDFLSICRSI